MSSPLSSPTSSFCTFGSTICATSSRTAYTVRSGTNTDLILEVQDLFPNAGSRILRSRPLQLHLVPRSGRPVFLVFANRDPYAPQCVWKCNDDGRSAGIISSTGYLRRFRDAPLGRASACGRERRLHRPAIPDLRNHGDQ